MCLIFLSYNMSPKFKLVVAANRDEFYNRPTAPLDYLDTSKTLLCGTDLQGGGTWLGISSDLKFGAITNFRQGTKNKLNAPSRGEIILDYLRGGESCLRFLQQLAEQASQYEGFNLILGDSGSLYYFSNRRGEPRELGPGFYGLSNHFLDSPWPKVVRGKELLKKNMVDNELIDETRIFHFLADCHQPVDQQLPDTGVGLNWERMLAPIFIQSPGYGTRSSAVISVSYDGKVTFFEKTYAHPGSSLVRSSLVKKSINV